MPFEMRPSVPRFVIGPTFRPVGADHLSLQSGMTTELKSLPERDYSAKVFSKHWSFIGTNKP